MGETVTSGYVEQRESNGRMVTPLPGKHTITQADASILARKRWEKYRREAGRAIAEEHASVSGANGSTPALAWGFVVARQYTTLLDSDKPRFDDVYRLGQLIGAVPLAGELQAQAQADHGPAVVVALPGDVARALVDLLERVTASQAQVVDGQVRDAG